MRFLPQLAPLPTSSYLLLFSTAKVEQSILLCSNNTSILCAHCKLLFATVTFRYCRNETAHKANELCSHNYLQTNTRLLVPVEKPFESLHI